MWVNIVGFNLAWLGLVLYGNNFSVIALLWLAFHLYKVTQRKAEITLILLVCLIGTTIDTGLLHLGVFTFTTEYLIPFWLIVLWACFGATLNHSLAFLTRAKRWQLFCGLLFPPLSYIAGANLSAVTLNYSTLTTYFILSMVWGPLMIWLYLLKTQIFAIEKAHD